MGAIFGIVSTEKTDQEVRDRQLEFMAESLRHRGPDGLLSYRDPFAGFGEHRLNIDSSIKDAGPLQIGETVTGIDGLIYTPNHRNRKTGIASEYKKYGPAFIGTVEGDFSIFLYLPESRKLFLARDPFGTRPLFYRMTETGLCFASGIKALLTEERKPDMPAFYSYLAFGYNIFYDTFFEGIHELPPGAFLTWENGKTKIESYWRTDPPENRTDLSESRAASGLFERIEAAVKKRFDSDLSLGAFLSGGLDSGTIVGILSKLSDQKIKTISVGFAEAEYSELPKARTVSRHFGTDHHEYVVKPDDLSSNLVDLIRHCEMPIADNSIIPTYFAAKTMKGVVKTLFTGDGPDQFLAGSDTYADRTRIHTLFEPLIRLNRRVSLWKPPAGYDPRKAEAKNLFEKIVRNFCIESLPLSQRFIFRSRVLPAVVLETLFHPDWLAHFEKSGYAEKMFEEFGKVKARSDIDRMLGFDSRHFLSDNLLVKVDRMTAACGMGTIYPYLDKDLFRFISGLPGRYKLKGRLFPEKKHIMKQAVRNFLPPEILQKKKQGFETPFVIWLHKDLRDYVLDILLSKQAVQRPFLNGERYRKTIEAYLINGKNDIGLDGNIVFLLLTLEIWYGLFMGRPSSI